MRELRTAQRGYDWLRGATVDVIGSDERRECKVKVRASVEPKIYSNTPPAVGQPCQVEVLVEAEGREGGRTEVQPKCS